jgi:putative transposase
VHLNPQHHLDIDYRSFSFSSYQSIVSDKPTKLVREEVLTYFGGVENFIYSHDFKSEIVSEKFTFE